MLHVRILAHLVSAQLRALCLGVCNAALGWHAAQAVPVRLALGAQHVWAPSGSPGEGRGTRPCEWGVCMQLLHAHAVATWMYLDCSHDRNLQATQQAEPLIEWLLVPF